MKVDHCCLECSSESSLALVSVQLLGLFAGHTLSGKKKKKINVGFILCRYYLVL